MKSLFLFALSIIICTDANFFQEEEHVLQIEIHNIQKIEGKILVALYDDEENYLDTQNSFNVQAAVTHLGSMTIQVEVPYGEYAIGLFHDLNNNGELDTNLVGIPKEPYGFSNGRRGTFGPPSFQRAKFNFKVPGQVHVVCL